MRLNLINISREAAAIGFLLLFPGFLLYHYSIAQNWIPPFLGGLFGVVSLVLAAICLILLPWVIRTQLGPALLPGVVVMLTIAFYAAWAITNVLFIPEEWGSAAFHETASAMGTWLAVVFVGIFYPFTASSSRNRTALLSVLIIAALLHAMYKFKSPLGPYLTFSGADPDSAVSTYQGAGRSIVVTAIFLAAMLEKARWRFLVFAISGFLLVVLGSRTDAFTLLALMAVQLLLIVVSGRGVIPMVSAVLGGYLFVSLLAPIFATTRNAEILDLSSSSSWIARNELQVAALRVIGDSPILGTFGYHMRDGGAGFYAHNALSAWTNFGLLGFILYVGLLLFFTGYSFRRVISPGGQSALWFASFHLNLAGLIQALVAQPVFALVPALGWGVALNAMRSPSDDASR